MKYMWYRKSLGGILSSCYPLWHDIVIYPWTAKMCKQPLGCVAFCAVLITYSNKFARQSSYYLSVIAQRWDAHLPQLRSHTTAIKTKLCGHHTHSKSKRADNTSQKKKGQTELQNCSVSRWQMSRGHKRPAFFRQVNIHQSQTQFKKKKITFSSELHRNKHTCTICQTLWEEIRC